MKIRDNKKIPDPVRIYWQLQAVQDILRGLAYLTVHTRNVPDWGHTYRAIADAEMQVARALDELPET